MLNFYNEMAAKVQKIWRGYYTRKYVFDYYTRKNYLERLQLKNSIIRAELKTCAEQTALAQELVREQHARQKRNRQARRNHHLISSYHIPGIYNSPSLPKPMEEEALLWATRPVMDHTKPVHKSFRWTPSVVNTLPKHLPPLPVKPQGPFQDPGLVQRQRYKLLRPSLRVETDFYSLEKAQAVHRSDEWVGRLSDEIFHPFSRVRYQYQSLLNTRTKYSAASYSLRNENPQENISDKPFRTILPPITTFDSVNNNL